MPENPYEPPKEQPESALRWRRPHLGGVAFWSVVLLANLFSAFLMWSVPTNRYSLTFALGIGVNTIALSASGYWLWRVSRWFPPDSGAVKNP